MPISDKTQADFWKWIAAILSSVLVTVILTYAALSKDYITKDMFEKQSIQIDKLTDNLTNLTGEVRTLVGYLKAKEELQK